jgi:Zn-dependent alcohol dehydrogenase
VNLTNAKIENLGLNPLSYWVARGFWVNQISTYPEFRNGCVKGSYLGSCVAARDLPRYIALYKRGCLPVDKLITSRLRLADINAGFDSLREGRAVRQVIEF